ncbi:glycosyltransferase [Tepidicaulis sp.]|uniref:glycosyltransferase n=1 Tax=Tepidicaulis sp. TaxID=1920809 RepID=UPI003B5965A3
MRKRILHVGNIANNALINAGILASAGYENHVAAPDLYHFATTPEWQFLGESIGRGDIGPDYFPNFFKFNEAKDVRPRWFAQGPYHYVVNYLYYLVSGDQEAADMCWSMLQYQRFKAIRYQTTSPQRILEEAGQFEDSLKELDVASVFHEELWRGWELDYAIRRVYEIILDISGDETMEAVSPPFPADWLSYYASFRGDFAEELAQWRSSRLAVFSGLQRIVPTDEGPAQSKISWLVAFCQRTLSSFLPQAVLERETVSSMDVDGAPYEGVIDEWKLLLSRYEHRIMYGTSPILAYLANAHPYVAFEHGTIRSMPFEGGSEARLLAASYEQADAVFLTNTDYITAKPRLEFDEAKRYYAPHPFDEKPLIEFSRSYKVRRSAEKTVFLAPARQDWARNDPKWSKANNLIVEAAALLRGRAEDAFVVHFIEWGDDVQATQDLIAEKGLEENFLWHAPKTKRDLWKAYLDAHAVIDQFLISVISGVTFEALALGCRVITKDDGICNHEFFEGHPPPLFAASTPEEIAEQMRKVMEDPCDISGWGQRAQDWVLEYHSAERLVNLQERAFEKMSASYGPRIVR